MATEQGQNAELSIFDSALLLVVLVVAPVEEYVLLARVAVHVAVEGDTAFPIQIPDHLLAIKDGFMQKSIRLEPFTVQVAPE